MAEWAAAFAGRMEARDRLDDAATSTACLGFQFNPLRDRMIQHA
jgi:hypothetical protein